MSRTYKDKPRKIRVQDYTKDYVHLDGEYSWVHIWRKTTKTKKRKEVDTEDHWMTSGPSWYKNMFMNRPQRRAGRIWEATITRTDIEEADAPSVSRKPHIYWW